MSSTGLETILTKNACPRNYIPSPFPSPSHQPTYPTLAAGPYSQAIKAASQVWVAGQIPADTTGTLIEGTIAEKTAMCCQNLKAILEASGSEIGKVVRVGVFLTDMKVRRPPYRTPRKWQQVANVVDKIRTSQR